MVTGYLTDLKKKNPIGVVLPLNNMYDKTSQNVGHSAFTRIIIFLFKRSACRFMSIDEYII